MTFAKLLQDIQISSFSTTACENLFLNNSDPITIHLNKFLYIQNTFILTRDKVKPIYVV